MKINESFLAQMREATDLLQSSGPVAATAAIQRALHDAGMPDIAMPQPDWRGVPAATLVDINPRPSAPEREADAGIASGQELLGRFRAHVQGKWRGVSDRQPIQDVDTDVAGKGRFLSGSVSNQAGTRAYKLYIPSGYTGQPLPLIVMLHGCKQNPDDFAAGTTMNVVAEENNCFVVYPGQMQAANGSNCWNWFKHEDQQRGRGEPSIIADITHEIIRSYQIDTSRVYVAGLSAGGAMAVVMGATYPELYAAVGIHSGLPYGAAHDVPSAFAAMKNSKAKAGPLAARRKAPASLGHAMPVIVFHGDHDTTVHPSNGDLALAQCVPASASVDEQAGGKVNIEKGQVPNGHAYTKTMRHDAEGKIIAEQWVVHGAGHAWSGGSSHGSYTDPKGPSAAREMLRFFYGHARKA
ncbi:MAG TPA: PHB depolymerase family esterase [Noviherbaspirillum sp.]|nr:PHB depolymerase family esterase [Noviherbaspirillum sp.]